MILMLSRVVLTEENSAAIYFLVVFRFSLPVAMQLSTLQTINRTLVHLVQILLVY